MSLYNKLLKQMETNSNTPTINQVIAFLNESKKYIDMDLTSNFNEIVQRDPYDDDTINEFLLKDLRAGILSLMIFGYVHNQVLDVDEKLINMIQTHRNSIYSVAFFRYCSTFELQNSFVNLLSDYEIDKYPPIVHISSYAISMIGTLDFYLQKALEETKKMKIIDSINDSFINLYYLFNNPKERYPTTNFEYNEMIVQDLIYSIVQIKEAAEKLFNIKIDNDYVEADSCPFLNKSFHSKSIREINLVTNEKSVAVINANYLQPKEDELCINCYEDTIDEGVKIPWHFNRKDNNGNYYFTDVNDNEWEINKVAFSVKLKEEMIQQVFTLKI